MEGGSLGEPGAELLGVLACIVTGAIYAAIDESITAIGEPRLRAVREGNDANARVAARYLDAPSRIKLRLLCGRILCLAGTSMLAYDVAEHWLSSPFVRVLGVALAALCYAAAVGISSTVSAHRASRLALPLLRFGRPLELFALPFAIPLQWAIRVIETMFPARPGDIPERVTELDVEHMIDQGAEHGSIPAQNAELLRSVLEFGDTIVREIMVPRTSMVAIDISTPLDEVIELLTAEGHSRYPVYRERIDQVEGTLYAKDLFRFIREGGQAGKLADLIRRPVFFTAHSQKISVLLRQMQARRVHVAIVVDEFGGTSGMVTLEDIIEEIVGEIRDEHDTDETPVRQIGPDRYIANADVSLYDLAEITGLELPEQVRSYESLGGMLIDMAGRVPKSGDSIEVGGHEIIVRAADERRVSRVEVVKRKELPPAA